MPPVASAPALQCVSISRAIGNQRRAVLADAPAHGAIFLENSRRFVANRRSGGRRRSASHARDGQHSVDRPGEIHRRRPRAANAARARAEWRSWSTRSPSLVERRGPFPSRRQSRSPARRERRASRSRRTRRRPFAGRDRPRAPAAGADRECARRGPSSDHRTDSMRSIARNVGSRRATTTESHCIAHISFARDRSLRRAFVHRPFRRSGNVGRESRSARAPRASAPARGSPPVAARAAARSSRHRRGSAR